MPLYIPAEDIDRNSSDVARKADCTHAQVTIARAIANKPDILLLDEPTGDLDSVNTAIVLKLLTDLNQEGPAQIVLTRSHPQIVHRERDGEVGSE